MVAKDDGSILSEHCKGFPETLNPMQDNDGHGTHLASVFYKTAPLAALHIARIVDDAGVIPSNNDYESTIEVHTLLYHGY